MDEEKNRDEQELFDEANDAQEEITDPESDKIITAKNRRSIILYSFMFVILCAFITIAAYTYMSVYPYKKLAKSVRNSMEDIYEAKPGGIDAEGLKTLIFTSPTKTDGKFDYAGKEQRSADFSWNYDPVGKKAAGSLYISTDETGLDAVDCYADDKELIFKSDFLGEDYLSIPFNNVLSAYNFSELSEILGKTEYTQDISIDLFRADIFDEPELRELIKGYFSTEREAVENLRENVVVYKNDDYTMKESNKTAKGYTVTADGIYVSEVIDDFVEYAQGQSNSHAVAEAITPIICFITGLDNTAEETENFLDENRYSALEMLSEALSTQTVKIDAYIYKNRIVCADWDFTLNDVDSVVDCSVNIATDEEGFGRAGDITFICGDREIRANYNISQSGLDLGYEEKQTMFDAAYTSKAEFTLDEESLYTLRAEVENDNNRNDKISFSSAGILTVGADGLSAHSDNTRFRKGTEDMRTLSFDLNITPLSEDIVSHVSSPKALFDMPKEDLSYIFGNFYKALAQTGINN